MTKQFQEPFTTPPSSAIASFDWQDIASGTGYETFFLLKAKDDSADVYSLVPSSSILGVSPDENGYAIEATYRNFDTNTFTLPQTIKGIAYFTGQFNFLAADGDIVASLYHYDGTTETLIGTEATTAIVAADIPFCLAFDITLQRFKRGDLLRLKVKYSDSGIHISIDPTGTIPAGITPSRLVVPFRIDL